VNPATVMILQGAPISSLRELVKVCKENPTSILLEGDVETLANHISVISLQDYDNLLVAKLELTARVKALEHQVHGLECEAAELRLIAYS